MQSRPSFDADSSTFKANTGQGHMIAAALERLLQSRVSRTQEILFVVCGMGKTRDPHRHRESESLSIESNDLGGALAPERFHARVGRRQTYTRQQHRKTGFVHTAGGVHGACIASQQARQCLQDVVLNHAAGCKSSVGKRI